MYDLPTALDVCGVSYPVLSDYRAVLDVCAALTDVELTEQERVFAALYIFYPSFDAMPPEHYEDAIKQCFWFIDCGEEYKDDPRPKLMDWEQDFRYVVAPVNRVIGTEVRALEYLHWWSFVSAYMEIGDCTFAQVIRIRDQLNKGKPLDKADREWYRNNRHMVDIKTKYTAQEDAVLNQWGAK